MKILVTGAAGFIGSHCAEYFATQGHQVYGVDNFDPYYDLSLKKLNQHDIVKSGVVFIEADLQGDLSVKLPNDFDYVFHFAAQPGIDRKSTRLNSSHVKISYAVFCLKKK